MARKRLTLFQKTLRDLTCSVPEAAQILGLGETTVKLYAERWRDGASDMPTIESDKFGGTVNADGSTAKGTWVLSRASVLRLKREIDKR